MFQHVRPYHLTRALVYRSFERNLHRPPTDVSAPKHQVKEQAESKDLYGVEVAMWYRSLSKSLLIRVLFESHHNGTSASSSSIPPQRAALADSNPKLTAVKFGDHSL